MPSLLEILVTLACTPAAVPAATSDPAGQALAIAGVQATDRVAVLAEMDRLAARARTAMGEAQGSDRAVALADYLFGTGLALPATFGNDCVGLTVLALSVGHRLDIPLAGLAVPGHLFFCYDDVAERRAFDPTSSGDPVDEGARALAYGIAPEAIGRAWLRPLKGETFEAYLLAERAARSWLDRDTEAAREAASGAVRLDPMSVKGHYVLALVEAMDGALGEAGTQAKQVLDLDPRHPGAWALQGAIMLAEGRPAAAAKSVEVAVDLAPEEPVFMETFAAALGAAGDARGAALARMRAQFLRRLVSEASHRRGVVRDRGARGRPLDAVGRPDHGA